MVRPCGEAEACPAVAVVHSKRSNAAVIQLSGSSNEVGASMASCQPMQKQRRRIAFPPTGRAIVMQDDLVAVVQLDLMVGLRRPRPWGSMQIVRRQRLRMAALQ